MKSHSKESPPKRVWTEEETQDRGVLVVTLKEFEKVMIGEDIELFFKFTPSSNQVRIGFLCPRHIKISRTKI